MSSVAIKAHYNMSPKTKCIEMLYIVILFSLILNITCTVPGLIKHFCQSPLNNLNGKVINKIQYLVFRMEVNATFVSECWIFWYLKEHLYINKWYLERLALLQLNEIFHAYIYFNFIEKVKKTIHICKQFKQNMLETR